MLSSLAMVLTKNLIKLERIHALNEIQNDISIIRANLVNRADEMQSI